LDNGRPQRPTAAALPFEAKGKRTAACRRYIYAFGLRYSAAAGDDRVEK
jgi:hypothetical protein